MPLKDLLVHVDHSRQSAVRLDAAIALAAAHDAHLVGMYVLTHPHVPNFIRAQIPEEFIRTQAEAIVAYARRTREHFEDVVRRSGVKGEWRLVEGAPEPMLSLHGRYCDVCVVGQRERQGEDALADSDMPDRLILSIGRPVLVIPRTGIYPVIGERIMVAWDASRLAARAVNDALPLLRRAKSVSVLAINPGRSEHTHGEIPSADICLHLARHGVSVEAQHADADDINVGDVLLSRAADQGIDLLVMGAYGHARWRELVLGGATRHILLHMTVPVLMSH
jgi:nucleotide-binding universal stress UspA family protein